MTHLNLNSLSDKLVADSCNIDQAEELAMEFNSLMKLFNPRHVAVKMLMTAVMELHGRYTKEELMAAVSIWCDGEAEHKRRKGIKK